MGRDVSRSSDEQLAQLADVNKALVNVIAEKDRLIQHQQSEVWCYHSNTNPHTSISSSCVWGRMLHALSSALMDERIQPMDLCARSRVRVCVRVARSCRDCASGDDRKRRKMCFELSCARIYE